MLLEQRDENPAIQDFLQWINERRRTEGGDCKYVPLRKLKSYMTTDHHIQRLLYALFPHHDIAELPPPDYVERHYIRVFSILLCIGRGPFIMRFLEYPTLQDNRLPFASKPSDFPLSSQSGFFDTFWREQWKFCVPTLEYNMNVRFQKEEILPIIHKERLGSGGTSILYKIVVEDEYNHLDPNKNHNETGKTTDGVFVLKSYHGRNALENFETERKAFLKLRTGIKLPPNIIGFYGSFVQNEKYNLILDYADMGTLEDFLQSATPPRNTVESVDFWESALGLLRGLTLLHGSEDLIVDDGHHFWGWHQDITPSNILIKSRAGRNKYQLDFELADLGLTHFKKNDSTEVTDKDSHGAPETLRADDSMLQARLQVRQDVDIWSLGCVFSEILTWSVCGWSKVLEYRLRRQEESKVSIGNDAGDLFHDGHKRLATVSEIHKAITQNLRARDLLSSPLMELIDNDMMQQTGSRASAGRLYLISRKLIEHARRHAQDYENEDWSPKSVTSRASTALFDGGFGPLSTSLNACRDITPEIRSATPTISSTAISMSAQSHMSGMDISTSPSPWPDPTESRHSNVTKLHPSITGDASIPALNSSTPPAPYLAFKDGLEWRARSKKTHTKLPYEELLKIHKRRDHIFLLDTSASMEEHYKNVKMVVELLSYMLNCINPDGISIYLTSGSAKVVSKKTKGILAFLESAQPKGITNMEQSLGNILADYLRGSNKAKSRFITRWAFGKSVPKALSIYVFTDGMWQPKDEPYDPIASLSRLLQKENMPRNHVGIQFIKFGHDPTGTKRLKELDSSRSRRAQPLDIVDTEPYDGNVLKMLLGSINHWYDEDAYEEVS